jgi:hypothetical protein
MKRDTLYPALSSSDAQAELREIAIELMTALDMLDGMIAAAPPERRAPSPRSVHTRVTAALERVRLLLDEADAGG